MPPFSTHPIQTGSSPQTYDSETLISPSWVYPITPISERAVDFEATVEVIAVPTKDHYTKQESKSIWYTYAELEEIQRDAQEVARRLQRKTLRRDDCTRGVKTAEGMYKAQQSHLISLYAVLSEQEQQKAQDKRVENPLDVDPQVIEDVYSRVAEQAKEKAICIANRDSKEAKNYYEEEEEEEEDLGPCWFLSSWFPKTQSSMV